MAVTKVQPLLSLLESVEIISLKQAIPMLKDLYIDNGEMKHWLEDPESESDRTPGEIAIQKENDKIIGWAGLGLIRFNREENWVASVFVDKDHRGKGIGKSLVNAILKHESPEDSVYYDPDAPQLKDWIESAGFKASPIPNSAF